MDLITHPHVFFPLEPKAPVPAFSQFVNPDVKTKMPLLMC